MRFFIISRLFLFLTSTICFESLYVNIDLDRENEHIAPESEEFYYIKISKDQKTILGRALTEKGVKQLKNLYKNVTFHRSIINREGYLTHDNITNILRNYTNTFPNITRLFSIGKSVEGKDLWVLEISISPNNQNNTRPNVKYIANMHGDEVVGREMLMRLIDLLLNEYGKSPRITNIINSVNIFIMPTMNPDGFDKGIRENANGYDLNRNFPDQFRDNKNTIEGRQKEVQRVMEWISSQQFTLSANIHGGDVVANYPWDGSEKPFPPKNNPTTDDDTFREISYEYARLNPTMISNPSFENGITNGAAWYSLFGGMQDWNYIWRGCMEITLELSYIKWPPASELDTFWNENKDSLLNYLEQVNKGFRGIVTDASTNKPINNALISVKGRELKVYSRENGAYFRIITSGNYTVQVSAENYETIEVPISVNNSKIEPTILNVELRKINNNTPNSYVNYGSGMMLLLIGLIIVSISLVVTLFIIYILKFTKNTRTM